MNRVFICILIAACLQHPAAAAVFNVDRLTDFGTGDGLAGDLRYCITQANTNGVAADTITFGVTGTVNLASPLPDLTTSMAIEGPSPSLLTIRRNSFSAGSSNRIFTVWSGVTASLSGLTMTNGYANASDFVNPAYGGGILNAGTLSVSNSVITGNQVEGFGGGIANFGAMMLVNVTVSNNNPAEIYGGDAGGIYNQGTLTINNSAISNNSAYTGGGILQYEGTTTLSNSTVSNNSAYFDGGGIEINGTMTISNSTISGNQVVLPGLNEVPNAKGGGIYSWGTALTIANSTITGNSVSSYNLSGAPSAEGGGIYGPATLGNTIVAGNSAANGPDTLGSISSLGHNLIGNTSGGSGFDPTDLLNVNPLLGPLQNNGGPTLTHALLSGSLAINAGDPAAVAGASGVPSFDQRGALYTRVYADRIDIGAFELQPIAPPTLPGDFNGDGSVDAADYVLWRKTLGQVGGDLAADGNNNGEIDHGDYGVWRTDFGRTAGAGATGSTGAVVPEPVSGVLLMIGLAIGVALLARRSDASAARGRSIVCDTGHCSGRTADAYSTRDFTMSLP